MRFAMDVHTTTTARFRRCATTFAIVLTLTCGEIAAQTRLPNLGELKTRLVQYKQSGAYDRDVAQLLGKAQKFIARRADEVSKPAIVLDIDETSLSNWPQLVANDFGYIPAGPCDALPAGPCGVRSWETSARAEAITPTLTLFKQARARGVAVFFISGRRESERSATENNLRQAGYEDWAGVVLRPPSSTGSPAPFKAGERQKIAAQGYTIIANIGDQPSDLSGGYSGRTFLVPNPFYRIP
jgi:predicted secreted acid phosphatase